MLQGLKSALPTSVLLWDQDSEGEAAGGRIVPAASSKDSTDLRGEGPEEGGRDEGKRKGNEGVRARVSVRGEW